MALIVYSNGIIEEMVPLDKVFTEDGLVETFSDYPDIKTYRLSEIPNCWCIWGDIDDPPPHEFNKLATEIIGEDVYSHLIFVHDSEVNPSWNLTDEILYKSYPDFLISIGNYIKNLYNYLATEVQKEYEEEETTNMIFLTVVGSTNDKRVLYKFDPKSQHETFYEHGGGWNFFAHQIYEYLLTNFSAEPIEENKPLVIYADAKTIVIIDDEHVDEIILNLIAEFESRENYEACKFITETKDEWYRRKTLPKTMDPSTGPPKKKRGRPPKDKKTE